jgi:OMPG-porin 1 family
MLLLSLSPVAFPTALRTLTAAVGLWLLLPQLSHGAEWALKAAVDQDLGYDTNVLMQQNEQGSFKYMIVPTLTFIHRTDVSEVQADASYGTQVFSEIPQLNQDIQNYSMRGLYKAERFDWGASWNYAITPTRNNAVQSSGNFNSASVNNTWSISPFVTYKINETDSLSLTPSYSESAFTNANASDNFRDRTNTNINLAWQRLWSERYSSSISFFYSNSQSEQGSSNAQSSFSFDSVGLNLTNSYAWSENWKLDGTVGVRHTDSEIDSIKSDSMGFLADINLNYTGENYSSGVYFNRSLTPSFQGQLQEQTSVGLHFSYKIAERLTARLSTGYQESTLVNSNDQNGQSSRENLTVNPALSYQLSPEWTLSGSYRYRTQNRALDNTTIDTTNQDVESNLFLLSINYNWQGLSISR